MARSLNGTTQYLSRTNPIGAFPFTIAGWMRHNSVATDSIGWAMYQSGADNYLFGGLLGTVAGDPYRTDAYPNAAPGTATTSTSFSANTWHHCASVMTSASSFASLLDGAGKGTNSGSYSGTIASLGVLTFGYLRAFSLDIYSQNDVAHWGIWNVALSDSEVASLAAGFCPLLVRPSSLVAYYPLGGFHGDYDRDLVGGYNLTPSGSPTFMDQPRIIYPQGAHGVQLATSTTASKFRRSLFLRAGSRGVL